MTFHIITIFPESMKSYIETSILYSAQKKGKVKIKFYNLRDYTKDKHRKVDDKPYSGGAGMVLMAEPILQVVESIKSKIQNQNQKNKVKKSKRIKVIILSAKGKQFTQNQALNFSKKYDHIILIAGRYEGIDERVRIAFKAEEISVGPYVLTDGELPALVLVSAISRLIPDVINKESLSEESFGKVDLENRNSEPKTEYAHYTRPEVIKFKGKNYRVPKVLLSGDHKKIIEWRRNN